MCAALKEGTVYRYKKTGKLVMEIPFTGQMTSTYRTKYIDINKDLEFLATPPHGINTTTEIEETNWRIEFEDYGDKLIYVRNYSIDRLPDPSNDERVPLEKRLNVSPSELYNKAEIEYKGSYRLPGSWKKRLIITIIISFISLLVVKLIGPQSFYPGFSLFVFILGLIFVIQQYFLEPNQISVVNEYNRGVDFRDNEIIQAKDRIRNREAARIDNILSDFNKWKKMDGRTFERATARIFREKGYKVVPTQTSYDGGIDLTLKKDGENIGVQCKAYNKNVGVAAVRETIGVKAQWPKLNKFMVVSLHGFSKQAIELAEKQSVELFSIRRDYFKIP